MASPDWYVITIFIWCIAIFLMHLLFHVAIDTYCAINLEFNCRKGSWDNITILLNFIVWKLRGLCLNNTYRHYSCFHFSSHVYWNEQFRGGKLSQILVQVMCGIKKILLQWSSVSFFLFLLCLQLKLVVPIVHYQY